MLADIRRTKVEENYSVSKEIGRATQNSLVTALAANHFNVIAEIKRRSPSQGVLSEQVSLSKQVKQYIAGGASAISVLTDKTYFNGSYDDLFEVANIAKLYQVPVLCKDFIVSKQQIDLALQAGADAVLLITGLLEEELPILYKYADALQLDVLVEIHNSADLTFLEDIKPRLIGVNNRNLNTFEVSFQHSLTLYPSLPKDTLLISESGIRQKEDVLKLKHCGFDGVLVGTSLMRASNPAALIQELLSC